MVSRYTIRPSLGESFYRYVGFALSVPPERRIIVLNTLIVRSGPATSDHHGDIVVSSRIKGVFHQSFAELSR